MRWDRLFDDLESQLEQELDAEQSDLVAEEERLRLGRLALRDRLTEMIRSEAGAELDLVLRDGSRILLAVGSSGRDWIAGELRGDTRVRAACILPIASIGAVAPRGDQLAVSLGAPPVGDPQPELSARLGLGFVLRELSRRRSPVDLATSWGRVHGTIDRIGRDHLDLAEHEPGAQRRGRAVRRTLLVPFSEILFVRY
ncbi:hypothetical protein GCM10027515_00890 [Schumannella luteola]|uniref:Uncharacterized protein YdcH (DUF465 family) n=1 Tax=Schumannella luteola TaxID=472059 RepID=A0A852YC62_9MICO|nr:hypothetical protein [Schumannella luteola]NYG98771.1 uncharacterized protein YdcH (DUF465 family) [Schumannella luteola]TPW90977.1 hypothetical protein FJ656_36330 [Schumannella luteola]